jgi:hypothetical protein
VPEAGNGKCCGNAARAELFYNPADTSSYAESTHALLLTTADLIFPDWETPELAAIKQKP